MNKQITNNLFKKNNNAVKCLKNIDQNNLRCSCIYILLPDEKCKEAKPSGKDLPGLRQNIRVA